MKKSTWLIVIGIIVVAIVIGYTLITQGFPHKKGQVEEGVQVEQVQQQEVPAVADTIVIE